MNETSPSQVRSGSGRAARVLVVDDDAEMRELLERVLRRDGHSVAHATNGRDALCALTDGAFDLVLTDLLMPEMDGIELIRELMVQSPGTPVVVLSGADAGGGNLLRAARVFGAAVALEKAISPAAIRATVRRVLGAADKPSEAIAAAA
jgi:CheY-like chemotaxis protein